MDIATTSEAATSAPATSSPAEISDTDLSRMAMEADAGKEPTFTPTSESAPDKSAAATESAESANQGKEAKATEDAAKPQQKPDEPAQDKKETPFQKAKADQERRDRSWKALNEEKEKFRAEKVQFESRIKDLETQLASTKKQAGPARDAEGYTAEVWDKVAAKAEAEGDDVMAKAAKERAEKLRSTDAAPASAAPAQSEPWRSPEFQQAWQQNVQEIVTASPELNDPQNPIFKSVNALVNDQKWSRFFRAHPDGVKAALEVARLIHAGEAAKKTAEEAKALKAEVARLNKLIQPSGSLPAGQAAPKRPEDFSDDEIRAAAMAADRG
ncbi:hypothetical protein [Nibricoccus sp. IMCC34717]|uniref:hypothetical protein n=1 Tax=Nibricoccus sp. IMCC34717 TaxID=3034021 RepID=UPI00384F4278